MYRAVCTDLHILVHMVRIPDEYIDVGSTQEGLPVSNAEATGDCRVHNVQQSVEKNKSAHEDADELISSKACTVTVK